MFESSIALDSIKGESTASVEAETRRSDISGGVFGGRGMVKRENENGKKGFGGFEDFQFPSQLFRVDG
ncbi:hypothetical protein KY290_000168 [Solanum tuberosum]|uniref:Uncharacterized protein n=1 Tax=Solanum tuberosum TaxID=4113 RepID=A0ABQ7WKR5_SOLTU|nr:hypothetical protein KY290_000168 [Solanum tuberosum]